MEIQVLLRGLLLNFTVTHRAEGSGHLDVSSIYLLHVKAPQEKSSKEFPERKWAGLLAVLMVEMKLARQLELLPQCQIFVGMVYMFSEM